MNEQEFIDSLSPSQAKFYNDRLISVRVELQTMFANTEQELVKAHAEIADTLTKACDELKAKNEKLTEEIATLKVSVLSNEPIIV